MLPADPSLSVAERVDAACDRFEAEWKAGGRPRVEDYVAAAPQSDREELRQALHAVERELQGHSGSDTSGNQSSVPSHASQVKPELEVTVDQASKVDPSVGTVGRFEIRGVLGSGAFGKVYRAFDPQLRREVALKVPLDCAVQSEHERAQFLKEARSAATINHVNVCQIYEVGEADGRPYIVMALVRGQSLADLIKARKEPLPEKQAALIVRKIALALAAAHERGIVHRDLKPANVMLDRERKDVVVMDFGLARGPKLGDARGTKSGVVMGTPAYMSPEQARGDAKDVGPAGDIFSLGVILYELLLGARPFVGTATEVIGQILHVDPQPPSRLRAGIDPRLEAVCIKAMAKEPAARFTTMKEFAAAIDRILRTTVPAGASADTARAEKTRQDADQPSSNTTNLADVFAALSMERKKVRAETAAAVDAAVRKHRTPRWIFVLVALLLFGGLTALAGIVFYAESDKVKVTIELTAVDLSDKSLSFFLDDEPVSAEALANPIELAPGQHVLVVKRGDDIVKRMLLTVKGGRDVGIKVKDITPPVPPPVATPVDGFVQLFNGKDLSGWTLESGDQDNWTVRDGVIVASTPPDNPYETWLLSEQNFRNCVVRFEFKAVTEDAESGIALRAVLGEKQPAEVRRGTSIKPTHFHIKICGDGVSRQGLAIQTGTVLGTINTGLAPKAIISANARGKQKPVGEWNLMEVRLRDQKIQVHLNDKLVVTGDLDDLIARGSKAPALSRREGRIGFVRRRGTFQFRNIRIKDLDVGFTSLFNGKDFAGWKNPDETTVLHGWVVKEGAIVRDKNNPNEGEGREWQRNNLWTTEQFENFILELEFRGTGINTLVIRADQPNNPFYDHGLHVPLNLQGSTGIYWPPGSFYPFRGPDPMPRITDDWNQLRLTAAGPRIVLEINGEPINHINVDRWAQNQPGTVDPGVLELIRNLSRKGHIGLNAREGDLSLRNLRIKQLDSAAGSAASQAGSQVSDAEQPQ